MLNYLSLLLFCHKVLRCLSRAFALPYHLRGHSFSTHAAMEDGGVINHRWTRGVEGGGGHPPLLAKISTPPEAEIHPPLERT